MCLDYGSDKRNGETDFLERESESKSVSVYPLNRVGLNMCVV